MDEHLVIDGNNLLPALRESGALPSPGRETLVRLLERWTKDRAIKVTLVFDGAAPPGPMARQLASTIIDVRFSAPRTADDVIVEMVQREPNPARLRVVSDDGAIRHEAGLHRCRHIGAARFVAELFPGRSTSSASAPRPAEKPDAVTPDEKEHWQRTFGHDEDEPFDGHEAMVS